MYYVVNNDATLLHRINGDVNKFIQKIGRFLRELMFGRMFTCQTNYNTHVKSRKPIIYSHMIRK